MTYKLTLNRTLISCKWILISILFIVIITFFGPVLDKEKSLILMLGVLTVFLIISIPQIYLLLQYEKVTNYSSFEIDYEKSLFIITTNEGVVRKQFADLKNIQHHKPLVPTIYLSLMLKLCEHLYFYKFEFKDHTKYYLTSLVSPEPILLERGPFYNYFIMAERKFASIK